MEKLAQWLLDFSLGFPLQQDSAQSTQAKATQSWLEDSFAANVLENPKHGLSPLWIFLCRHKMVVCTCSTRGLEEFERSSIEETDKLPEKTVCLLSF